MFKIALISIIILFGTGRVYSTESFPAYPVEGSSMDPENVSDESPADELNSSIVWHWEDSFTPLDSFLDDWTAPHEMSHLSIPYIGEKNAWFADVVAEYLVCCRLNDRSLEDVLASWDEIISERVSWELLRDYENKPANEMIYDFHFH